MTLNSYIDAICLQLGKIGPHPCYTEAVKQGFDTPCFIVRAIIPGYVQVRGDLHLCDPVFEMRYHPDDNEPRRQCYDMADKFLRMLRYITLSGEQVRAQELNCNIVDGVLIATAEYPLYVLETAGDIDNMEQLVLRPDLR